MLRFIICEDNLIVQKKIRETIEKIEENRMEACKTSYYSDFSNELKEEITQGIPSIYILDLQLKRVSSKGFEIARFIRTIDTKSPMIILTITNNLQGTAFKNRLDILDYIVKSDADAFTRLYDSIKIAINRLKPKKEGFFINSEQFIVNLLFSDILYIHRISEKRKVYIYTTTEIISTNESLETIEKKLDERFFKTHRSWFINLDFVSKIDPSSEEIYLNTGKVLTCLSRNRKKDLLNYINLR